MYKELVTRALKGLEEKKKREKEVDTRRTKSVIASKVLSSLGRS